MAADEISDWAEALGAALVDARLAEDWPAINTQLARIASSPDPQEAFELLIVTSRTVALVLRPAGHPGGPIGAPEQGLAASDLTATLQNAGRLLGCAATGDFEMARALAEVIVAQGMPAAAIALRAMLEVLAREPIVRADPPEPHA